MYAPRFAIALGLIGTLAACNSSRGDGGGGGGANPGRLDPPETNGPVSALPDLAVDLELLKGNSGYAAPWIAMENRATDDCAVVEGCIVAGPRQVLKFNVGVANVGDIDLDAPNPSQDPDDFEYSACHHHYHYKGFASYTLTGPDGVVATGRKQAFCLMDVQQFNTQDPPTGNGGFGFNCSNQGISRGYEDVYDDSLDCQWVDITDVAPGTYTLTVEVNAAHRLAEKGPGADVASVDVTIP